MTKHLFRINLTNPATEEERKLVEQVESFRRSDEELSKHFPVHLLDVSASQAIKEDGTCYARDLITEWGNTLFVKPQLIGNFPFHYFKNSPFKRMMKKEGYKKKILPMKSLSEGGRFVFGEEFVFISNCYGPMPDEMKEFIKKIQPGKYGPVLGGQEEDIDIDADNHKVQRFIGYLKKKIPGKELYFMPTIRGGNTHIDCDYQIIDPLRLIYVSIDLCKNSNTIDRIRSEVKEKLEKIAERHNFELRKYRIIKSEESPSGIFNGINSILYNNKFFTGNIHPEEKEYLERRGLEVIVVPLGGVDGGAGLRCVYGEFNL